MSTTYNIWQRRFLHPKYIGVWFFLGLLYCVAQLPWRLQYSLGNGLGWLLYYVAKKRRHITETNVDLCFSDLSDTEKTRRVKAIFKANAIGYMETAIAWFGKTKHYEHRVEIRGLHHLKEAASKGKGILLAGAHFSMLDLSCTLSALFFKFNISYRPLKNALFNEVMMQRREKFCSRAIHKKNVKEFINLLNAGEILWYAPDQDYGPKHSVFVNFFGVPAATITGLTFLHEATQALVCPYSCFRNKANQGWILEIHAPLNIVNDPTQDAQAFNDWLESVLSEYPEQYLWFHRRFKTRPNPDDVDFYA